MKRKIIFSLLLLFSIAMVSAVSVEQLLPNISPEHMAVLKEGKIVNVMTTSTSSESCISTIEDMGAGIDFVPDETETIITIAPENSKGKAIAENSKTMGKGFYVGFLSLLPYPPSMTDMTQEQKMVMMFDKITNISTQKGMTYNSHLAGNKEVTLFKDASIISNPRDMSSKIADPKMDSLPETYSCYSYQRDNRFGRNVYRIDFQNNQDEIFMDLCNYTTMRFMLIPCVEKGTLHMYMDVIPTDEGVLLFAMAKIENRDTRVNILNITVDLPTCFLRRITAMGKWFKNNLYE